MSRLVQRSSLGLALFFAAVACSPQMGEPARQPPLPDVQANGPSLTANVSAGAPADMKGVEATPGNPAGHDVTVTQAVLPRHRNRQHRLRDRYRHPRQTLEFFRLQPKFPVPADRMTLKVIKPGTARKHSGNPQLH